MGLQRLRVLLPIVLVIALLSGCGGGDFGSVSGKVTLDGKPLKGAYVEFQPVHKGRPSSGVTDQNGHYELMYTADQEGAEIGEHTVRITLEKTGKDKFGGEITLAQLVPAKYNVESILKRKVKAGDQEFNFPLKTGKTQ